MDGSPQLLTNIQFAEAKKGYDRDQVDNFLRELSVKIGELQDMLRHATQRAEAAETRATEAARAQSSIEGEIDELKSALEQARADVETAKAAAPAPSMSGGESAAAVLTLAQKTADAAIAEAETKAADTVADAKSRAAVVVMEAEQEAARVKREAIDEADRLRSSRVSRMEAEVEKLSNQRDGLQADLDALGGHLDRHRATLREHVDFFGRLLDDPGPLHLAPPPELVGESYDGSNRRTGPAAAARANQVPTLLEGPATEPASDTSESAGGSADDEEPAPAAADAAPIVEAEPEAAGADEVGGADEVDPADDAADPLHEPAADTAARLGFGESDPGPAAIDDRPFQPEGNGAAAVQSSLIDLTAAKLFEDNAGEPTQAFDVLAAPDEPAPAAAEDEGEATLPIESSGSAPAGASPLGEPDAEADKAMRAFFERDFDEDGTERDPHGNPGNPGGSGGRFLRRK